MARPCARGRDFVRAEAALHIARTYHARTAVPRHHSISALLYGVSPQTCSRNRATSERTNRSHRYLASEVVVAVERRLPRAKGDGQAAERTAPRQRFRTSTSAILAGRARRRP